MTSPATQDAQANKARQLSFVEILQNRGEARPDPPSSCGPMSSITACRRECPRASPGYRRSSARSVRASRTTTPRWCICWRKATWSRTYKRLHPHQQRRPLRDATNRQACDDPRDGFRPLHRWQDRRALEHRRHGRPDAATRGSRRRIRRDQGLKRTARRSTRHVGRWQATSPDAAGSGTSAVINPPDGRSRPAVWLAGPLDPAYDPRAVAAPILSVARPWQS